MRMSLSWCEDTILGVRRFINRKVKELGDNKIFNFLGEYKEMIFFWIGILCMSSTVVLAVYVGLWVCFAGEIVSILSGITAAPMSASLIGWGFLKIFVAWVAGCVTFIIGWAISMAIIHAGD